MALPYVSRRRAVPTSTFRLPPSASRLCLFARFPWCHLSSFREHESSHRSLAEAQGSRFFLARTRPFCAPARFREESLVQGTKLYCTLSSMRLLSRSDANTAATVQSSCPTADALPQLLASCNNDPQSPAP